MIIKQEKSKYSLRTEEKQTTSNVLHLLFAFKGGRGSQVVQKCCLKMELTVNDRVPSFSINNEHHCKI